MVFTCYLDDSYTDGGSVVTLGGYFALTENWKKFEREMPRIYDSYGIKVLHSKDLHGTKRAFRGWTVAKKKNLVQDLFIVARSLDVIGVSYSVQRSLTKQVKATHKLGSQTSDLGILFGMASAGVCANEGLIQVPGERDVSFVVEAGNDNNAGILTNFNKQKARENDPVPRAKSLSFVKKQDCYAIQLADFWAFYSRRAVTKMLQDNFQNEENLVGSYFDTVANTACIRARHTMNVLIGPPERLIGQRNKFELKDTRTYEIGPPPSRRVIQELAP